MSMEMGWSGGVEKEVCMGSMNSSLQGCRKKITFLLILVNPMFSSPSSFTLPCFLSSLFPSFPPSFSCPPSCLLPSCSLFLPFSLSFLRSCYETPAGPQLTVPSLQSPECWDDNLNFCSWLCSSYCLILYGSDMEGQPWGLWS